MVSRRFIKDDVDPLERSPTESVSPSAFCGNGIYDSCRWSVRWL